MRIADQRGQTPGAGRSGPQVFRSAHIPVDATLAAVQDVAEHKHRLAMARGGGLFQVGHSLFCLLVIKVHAPQLIVEAWIVRLRLYRRRAGRDASRMIDLGGGDPGNHPIRVQRVRHQHVAAVDILSAGRACQQPNRQTQHRRGQIQVCHVPLRCGYLRRRDSSRVVTSSNKLARARVCSSSRTGSLNTV